jgi:hypothetical protein
MGFDPIGGNLGHLIGFRPVGCGRDDEGNEGW